MCYVSSLSRWLIASATSSAPATLASALLLRPDSVSSATHFLTYLLTYLTYYNAIPFLFFEKKFMELEPAPLTTVASIASGLPGHSLLWTRVCSWASCFPAASRRWLVASAAGAAGSPPRRSARSPSTCRTSTQRSTCTNHGRRHRSWRSPMRWTSAPCPRATGERVRDTSDPGERARCPPCIVTLPASLPPAGSRKAHGARRSSVGPRMITSWGPGVQRA